MISIAIPLYNKALSIESTIRCIQAQTYQDFEVVVVEGWSNDGSTEIIKSLAAEDSRIKVLMQQDRHGVTPARNESVAAASGNVIAFIDADDIWEPTYLEQLNKLILDFPDAGIWGLSYGELCKGRKDDSFSKLAAGFRGIVENPWVAGSPYWTGATAISRKAFDAVGGFDNRIIYGEDIDLWYRIMLRFPAAFEVCDSHLAYYRIDAENRACNHVFPLKLHIPYYIDKYAADRAGNADFRKYFDRQCLYRLFPYTCKKEYRKDLHRILRQIDFSLQKPSLKWRFIFPRLYKLHQRRKGRISTPLEEYQGGSQDKKI